MSASIIAVDVDGSVVGRDDPNFERNIRQMVEWVAELKAERRRPVNAALHIVACVARARTACAVAHEHARRLGFWEGQLHGGKWVQEIQS